MSEEECSPSKLPRLESPESLPESPWSRLLGMWLEEEAWFKRHARWLFPEEWKLIEERGKQAENWAKQIIDQLPCDGRYSSSNPLKVTILATHWNPRRGMWIDSSSSLLTEVLSKKLARFPQVKVSVLVPEGLCYDGGKTFTELLAELFNITIVEAMKQPGIKDPLEWLYFPPESLTTDVVIGVGGRLGKVAEIFKRFQHCKSICFRQDQYEELNHELRDLSRALAEENKEKPELRHRSNGDDSLYADLSVAIGQEMYKQHRQNLIPAYLAARGPGALAAYRRALKTGKTYDRRIKIMLIGQDRSGKTSLGRYLRGETFNEQEPSTDGIEMIPSIKNAGTSAWKNPADLETTSAFHHKFAEVVTQEISSSYKNSTQQFVEEGKEPQEVTQETSSDLLTRETSELVASESIETYNPRHLENISKKDIEFQRNTGAQDAKKEQKLEEIPEKVLFLVERGLEGNDTSKTEEMWPVVWDFAGQAVYHAIHPIFLSQEDVYVLVSDLTQQLSAPAQCRVTTHSNDEIVVESPHDEDTNLDHMMRWLDLVHSLVKKKSESSKDILPSNAPVALLPPVVLVGTHADGVTNPREKMDFLFKTICEKASHATGKHISQESFFIDNSNPNREDDPQIVSLRKKLLDLSKRMPHINNEIPLQWLHVEEKIHQMVTDNQVRYVRKKSFKEDIAEGICQFNNTDDVEELLHFLQARGSVIYQDHPENPDAGLVVLDPQWLIRVLSEIITVSPPWKNDPSIQKDYQFLERRGLLSQQLLDRAFKNLKLEDIRDSLIHIMKKFVVICDSQNCNGEEYPYFVPCMLRLPLKNTKGTKVQNGPLPVFLKFNTKYVPSGLFCRLGVLFWDWTSKLYPHCKAPAFYANAARFQVSKDYHLTLKCHRTVIKLAIWTTCDSDSKEEQNLCEELLSHLEHCKFELSDTCHWLRSVTWELCVQCPLCEPCPDESRVGTGICIWHGQNDCRHDDCSHYLLLRSLDHGASCEYCVDDVPSLSAEKLKPWTQALESFKCKERNGKRKREMSPDCSNKRPKQPEGMRESQMSPGCSDKRLKQPKVKEGKPKQDELEELGDEIGEKWMALGRRLGVTEPEIQNLKQKHDTLPERGYQMLLIWKQKKGCDATYQALNVELQHKLVKRKDLAEKICQEKGSLDGIIQNLQRMQLDASKVQSRTELSLGLRKIASDRGFRISDNQGSGNCMFYALSEQLEIVKGIKIPHGRLRQTLVQYLRSNPKLPNGTDLFHFVDGYQTWTEYLTDMEQDGVWGDHLILCAAANLYKTCIRVVSSLPRRDDVIITPHCSVDESKALVLGHIHEVHYVSLQPAQD